jgi:hypothetical protein
LQAYLQRAVQHPGNFGFAGARLHANRQNHSAILGLQMDQESSLIAGIHLTLNYLGRVVAP